MYNLHLTELREKLQDCIDDPMWANHAEVSKSLLQKVLSALSAPAAGGLTDAKGSWFAYSEDFGLEWFDTEEEARAMAEQQLKDELEESRFSGEWCSTVEDIRIGRVTERAVAVDTTDPDEEGAEPTCDYVLTPILAAAGRAQPQQSGPVALTDQQIDEEWFYASELILFPAEKARVFARAVLLRAEREQAKVAAPAQEEQS